MEYWAHACCKADGVVEKQALKLHCRQVAIGAGACLRGCRLEQAGYISGLLHDAGKYKEAFQRYLLEGEGSRGSVNHTFAGCRMFLEHFHGVTSTREEDITAEILAFAAGAHHGLFDGIDADHCSGFAHRLTKTTIGFEESQRHFLEDCADWSEIEERFERAHGELATLYKTLFALASGVKNGEGQATFCFYLGLTARLLLSAVVEGDRWDAALFDHPEMCKKMPEGTTALWQAQLERMEEKLRQFSQDTSIDGARQKISDLCRQRAESEPGVYRLNVPTGSGKTLSGLRFALAHAAKWEKKRIIFVTPLLSILDQNARVIRDYVDEAFIVEHHSNVVQPNERNGRDFRELAVENWQAPVIITTMVQLLNTMFSGKMTSVRRFQALCDAVVVIDEVQTVPNHMLTLFNLAVNHLSAGCGTTFLLCSATQPCFELAAHPLASAPREVVPYDAALWQPFQRTVLQNVGSRRLDELPDFIRARLDEVPHVLVICNKKDEAAYLFKALEQGDVHCFHLSAAMCQAHRKAALKALTTMLADKEKRVLCVATQVIESGVDVSFDCVVRLSAGMDSIVQAAGRCNRNGEWPQLMPVYIVRCEGESLQRLRDIQRGKQVTDSLLDAFERRPEAFDGNLASEKAIRYYYEKLYENMASSSAGYQDFFVAPLGTSLYRLLSNNRDFLTEAQLKKNQYSLNQAFQTAGAWFKVFDDNTVDMVVPYGEGCALIAALEAQKAPLSLEFLMRWQEQVKPYTVSVYVYQKEKLAGFCYQIHDVWVLSPEAYDAQLGLTVENELALWEV